MPNSGRGGESTRAELRGERIPLAPPARALTPSEAELIERSPFRALGVSKALVRAVIEEGYTEPTPIQAQTIPELLLAKDLIGCAQTGTGKTAAFMLPLLQRLGQTRTEGEPRKIRALVLSPTRELASQISERAAAYSSHSGLQHAVIYGGVSQRAQERELRKRPELLVATPGRLLDLMQQGWVSLAGVEILVLDEADTMLDMGFIHAVRRIVAVVPSVRQTVMFSATMPQAIEALATSILKQPVRVSVTPAATAAETVDQRVYHVSRAQKRFLLERLLNDDPEAKTLVFTRTKRGANFLSGKLTQAGILAGVIHGNKSQSARERALSDFRTGKSRVLVATDVAARGIDVRGVSQVVNFELPNVPESYVHRIGRTGRAGAVGKAVSFCDPEERSLLRDIERLLRHPIPVSVDERMPEAHAPNPANGQSRNAAGGSHSGRQGSVGRGSKGQGRLAGQGRPGALSERKRNASGGRNEGGVKRAGGASRAGGGPARAGQAPGGQRSDRKRERREFSGRMRSTHQR